MLKTTLRLACIATLALACAPAFGQDTLKVAVGKDPASVNRWRHLWFWLLHSCWYQ